MNNALGWFCIALSVVLGIALSEIRITRYRMDMVQQEVIDQSDELIEKMAVIDIRLANLKGVKSWQTKPVKLQSATTKDSPAPEQADTSNPSCESVLMTQTSEPP